ncbi:MAG: Wzz/FepE/Etk N-terminal domain-containing protein [Acidobacteriota bacterium]|nr:Wzz/FepE/Etk N-terminal domain-containing protein [Acidobacteriota bacterium]
MQDTLKKRWKLIVGTGVLFMVLAAFLAALQPKQYRASAIAGVTTSGDQMAAGELYRGVEVLQQRTIVATVAALASVPDMQRQAFVPLSVPQDAYSVDAVVLPNTNLLRIDVEGHDPATAAKIANRIPAVLAGQTRSMYKLYSVATVSEARTPTAAVSPRMSRAIAAGAILGLLFGFGGALAKSYMRQKRSTARLTNAVPAP